MSEETKVFDWDDEVEFDGEERSFVTLEEGDYESRSLREGTILRAQEPRHQAVIRRT